MIRSVVRGGVAFAGLVTIPFGIAQGVENINHMRESAGALVSEEVRDRTPGALGPMYSVMDYGAAVLRNTGGVVEGVFDPGDSDPAHAFSHNFLVTIGGVAALRVVNKM
jgi:hypothetical protein